MEQNKKEKKKKKKKKLTGLSDLVNQRKAAGKKQLQSHFILASSPNYCGSVVREQRSEKKSEKKPLSGAYLLASLES